MKDANRYIKNGKVLVENLGQLDQVNTQIGKLTFIHNIEKILFAGSILATTGGIYNGSIISACGGISGMYGFGLAIYLNHHNLCLLKNFRLSLKQKNTSKQYIKK